MQSKESWEVPPCNNCSSNDSEVVWRNVTTWEYFGTFTIVKCKNCDLIYLNPRPTQDRIGNYYPKESYWGHDITLKTAKKHWKKEREAAYGFLYKGILAEKRKGTILDIGAGTGMFLTRFKELGWDVEGIELSKDAVRYAQTAYGVHLRHGDSLDFSFPSNSFDVVALNNALEHLYDPSGTLRKIHHIVKDDGIVVITVPNIDSLGDWIFGRNWYALQPPRHIYHFSPTTLEEMLTRLGFIVAKVEHGYWAHNYYSLFESFRILMSPRFRKKPKGGLDTKQYKRKFSIVIEGGKVFGKLFASLMAFLEPLIGKGEVITVYAKKRH